jgi:hypothetical protein
LIGGYRGTDGTSPEGEAESEEEAAERDQAEEKGKHLAGAECDFRVLRTHDSLPMMLPIAIRPGS